MLNQPIKYIFLKVITSSRLKKLTTLNGKCRRLKIDFKRFLGYFSVLFSPFHTESLDAKIEATRVIYVMEEF